MLHVYEFEVFEGESGKLLAFPYYMEGRTQGTSFKEACEMAVDWLQSDYVRDRAVNYVANIIAKNDKNGCVN